MKISQCMIVKNEANNLEKSLGNLKNIVYEQIVVDTGSTDNTVEVAKALGAKVYHFDWIDDFAAAKNFAIDQAKGDWILFLDADEYIENDKAAYLETAIEVARKKKAALVRMEMFHLDSSGNVFMKGVQDRLFLNRKDIRYSGKIHEKITSKRSNFRYLMINDIPIWHTGYMKEVVKDKNKGDRNITLIESELQKDPSNAQLYNYLADSLILNNQTNEALNNYRKAYNLIVNLSSTNKVTYLHALHGLLRIMKERPDTFQEAEALFLEASDKYETDPDLYFFMGQIYQNRNMIDQAIICYEKCLKFGVDEKDSVFNATLGKLYELNRILFDMYTIKKDFHNAVKKAVLLLAYDKYDFEVTSKFVTILRTSESSKDIFNFLNRFYAFDNLKDKVYLFKVFSFCEMSELVNLISPYFTDLEKREYIQN